MNFKNNSIIYVYYSGDSSKILVGRLAEVDRKILFEYDLEFLKTGLELSPFKLPLKPGIITSDDYIFGGLFGVFNDSLPDGWGRLLLDRKLIKQGINPGNLSPLDRLCYVGGNGMGALCYEPEIANNHILSFTDIDEISKETLLFLEKDNDEFIDDLLAMNGSSGGVRPKILVQLIGDSLEFDKSVAADNWIIKFRSAIDLKDIGPIEYAYHLMASSAKLDLPEARLFKSKLGPDYFGVRRFDCNNNQKLHMHTVSGLLQVSHSIPSLDYETLIKVTLWLTKDVRECEKLFRNAVFNVLSHNRDDHAKNFSFLMNKRGVWKLSPAYDLTFSSGPSGEHCTTIMGEGKNISLNHLLKLAEVANIKKQKAVEIIDEVKNVVTRWPEFAQDAGVSSQSITLIQKSLTKVALDLPK